MLSRLHQLQEVPKLVYAFLTLQPLNWLSLHQDSSLVKELLMAYLVNKGEL